MGKRWHHLVSHRTKMKIYTYIENNELKIVNINAHVGTKLGLTALISSGMLRIQLSNSWA